MSSDLDHSQVISVVGVGEYRQTADDVSHLLNGTPFRFAAMLDTDSPEPYNFTPDRLRLVLRSLNPVPRCFMAGEAIEESQNRAAIEVWEEFVREKGVERALCVNLRELVGKTLEETKATPKEQLMAETLLGMMMEHFSPQNDNK